MNLADTLSASFNNAVAQLVSAIPAIIGAIVILIVGWIVARIVSGIVGALLARAGADKMFAERGAEIYGTRTSSFAPSRLARSVVFWIIILVFLVAAANFLGWPQVSTLLNGFLSWLPNLIVAVIILIAAPVVARIARQAVEAGSAEVGVTSGRTLGRLTEIAIIAFAIVVAVNQVGIASDLVNIVFIGVVAALAIAFGLAFGLGGREAAAQLTQEWYARSKETAAKVQAPSKTEPSPSRSSGASAT